MNFATFCLFSILGFLACVAWIVIWVDRATAELKPDDRPKTYDHLLASAKLPEWSVSPVLFEEVRPVFPDKRAAMRWRMKERRKKSNQAA